MSEIIERIEEPDRTTRENLAWHLARYTFAASFVEPGARVLDAACGVGYGSRPLAAAGARVFGCDRAEDALATARRRGEPAQFLGVDLHSLPYRAGAFAGVVCFEALEHIVSPGAFLDEVVRVLAPGGWFAVSTPNPAFEVDNPFHEHELSVDELRDLLESRFDSVVVLGQRWSTAFRPAGWGSRLRDADRLRARRLLPSRLRDRLRRLAHADGSTVTAADLKRVAVAEMPLKEANPYVAFCRL